MGWWLIQQMRECIYGAWHSIGHSQDAFVSSSINFHAIFLLQSESRGHHRSTLATFLNPPLNGALDVSLPFGSAGRPWQERPDRGSNGRTDGRTEGRGGEGGDSGQTAGVRPLSGETSRPPPWPFAVTEMELINPVYSGNILQRQPPRR